MLVYVSARFTIEDDAKKMKRLKKNLSINLVNAVTSLNRHQKKNKGGKLRKA